MENQTETEADQKKRFALALLKTPDDPFAAALTIFPEDPGQALLVSNKWPLDSEVQQFRDEAKTDVGELTFLPTKADLCRLVWNVAASAGLPIDDRLKAMRLYGDIRGFIEKQGTTVNNNTNVLTNNKVMLVTDHGSDADWEQKLVEQQQRLIDDATATVRH